MEQKTQPHIIDVIFVLALFGAFAFSSVMLIIIGSNIYRGTINNMQDNFETRTSASYICEKVRQGELVESESVEGNDAIAIYKQIGEREYVTYLYERDGYLCELFTSADNEVTSSALAAGQKITELNSLSVSPAADSLIEILIKNKNGTTSRLLLSSYSED
ncbi:MAG: DUF4860 domain-containing protein [Lachnospiraceae bacterium]|nr:DUF4860 domain-containing protein [Lachnospiraceae bacterium]